MSRLQRFPADANCEQMLAAIRADGAIIIDNLIDPSAVAQLRAQTDPYMDASANGIEEFSGTSTTRTGAPGEQPETVSPRYALGVEDIGVGSIEDLASLTQETQNSEN